MKGLYIHIPFCIKKCGYCDFVSFCPKKGDEDAYLASLFADMEQYRGAAVDSVFVGGGTPTYLSPSLLERLFAKVGEIFALSENAEITIEANPKTLDDEKLSVLKKCGVNRISVGVQSFCDRELKALGRIHSAKDAVSTISKAKKYFDNINIDLMCAIPGQTKESFKKTLDTAFSLGITHISCYSLILEEGTPLFEEHRMGGLDLPDEDEEREIYELACDEMNSHGFLQYEISNFAKDGYRCRHNEKYWQCREYIGVGLGAHSYLDGVRFSKTDDFSSYISRDFNRERGEALSEAEKMSEFMFMGLRMTEGVSKTEFLARFGREIEDVFEKPVSKFKKMGMILEENGFLRLSHGAISVSNAIMCEFIL